LLLASWAIPGNAGDFGLDWATAREILTGGDPYHEFTGWVHPRIPAAHLLQLPLGLIPPIGGGWSPLAAAVLVAGSGTLLVWLVARRWWWAAPPLLLLWPFATVDVNGHPTFWYTSLLVLGFRQVESRPWLAGLLLAVASSYRLFPLLLVAGLFLARRRTVAGWASGWFAALNLAGLMLPGVSIDGTLRGWSDVRGVWFDHLWNLSVTRWAPVWVVAVPAVLYLIWAWGREWRRAWNVGLVASLVSVPLLWSTYLPVLLAWHRESPPAEAEGRSELQTGVDQV
jgi:hypothetical protein